MLCLHQSSFWGAGCVFELGVKQQQQATRSQPGGGEEEPTAVRHLQVVMAWQNQSLNGARAGSANPRTICNYHGKFAGVRHHAGRLEKVIMAPAQRSRQIVLHQPDFVLWWGKRWCWHTGAGHLATAWHWHGFLTISRVVAQRGLNVITRKWVWTLLDDCSWCQWFVATLQRCFKQGLGLFVCVSSSVLSYLVFLSLSWMLDSGVCFWPLQKMLNWEALPWSAGVGQKMSLANWKSGLGNKRGCSEKEQTQTLLYANSSFASL